MNALRVIVGMAGLALLAVIAWALFGLTDIHPDFFQSLDMFLTLPWGQVLLVDLYVGFLIFGVIVLIVERSWLRAALWALPVFVIGNVWAAVWLVLRMPDLIERLSKPSPPPS